MAPFQAPPKIKLSRLRDIGWSLWDLIGLLKSGQRWEDDECRPFANEYDAYLLNAAGRGGTQCQHFHKVQQPDNPLWGW